MAAAKKWVFSFGGGVADGDISMKSTLGGKGAGLAEMCKIGLNVPPGFTISAEGCSVYEDGRGLPEDMQTQVQQALERIERATQCLFGATSKPLLLSVRSGAAVSMPGMMDTVLNLGLNDTIVTALCASTRNERWVWDCYRRLIQMYADVVIGVKASVFEAELRAARAAAGVKYDSELSAAALCELVTTYKHVYKRETGEAFPQDPRVQLSEAINAVFRSWNNARAITYRKINHITGLLGTAVNVQSMVYGNYNEASGTGVLFTRNPSTGAAELYGEILMNAQGEDVVAGIRTPLPIKRLQDIMPRVYDELLASVTRLEAHMHDMQDVEYTIHDGTLYILQCRDGKRTGAAALKIASDMLSEGLVTEDVVLQKMITPGHIDQLLHPRFADEKAYKANVIGKGMPASPGAAVGRVVFTAEEAEAGAAAGDHVILVRVETSAEDVAGMHAAQGILTAHGGMTSHAAVVARGWGKPCVVGCSDISIDLERLCFTSTKTGVVVHKGDMLSLHGGTGEVIHGAQATVKPTLTPELSRFLDLANRVTRMHVFANADSAEDARVALSYGARGVGLCRTEHMFWGGERIRHMREAILAASADSRRVALDALFVHQKEDFEGIFRAVGAARRASGDSPMPVTIRLLDPPLHEYLPFERQQQQEVADEMHLSVDVIAAAVRGMREANPMMGCRGVRVAITKPEIPRMQVRAIMTAACAVVRDGISVTPHIMIPLVGTLAEFTLVEGIVRDTAAAVCSELGVDVPYRVGTMIELPRACIVAGAIASRAEFFSFGTNDLTATTLGYSRDDAPKFIPRYIEAGVLPDDPFQTLDVDGVGELMRMAVTRGRVARPGLDISVCGEIAGDERSVPVFEAMGVDHLSVSPYRVPVALWAAAQAAMKQRVVTAAAAAMVSA